MTPDEQERLEALLRGLPLRQPSAALDHRLAKAWPRRARARRRFAAVAVLTAAASLMILVAYRGAQHATLPVAPVSAPDSLPAQPLADSGGEQPVQVERVWCTPLDSQIVIRDDAPPVLHERRQVTRQFRQIDERSQVAMEWTMSGEETVVVPLDIN